MLDVGNVVEPFYFFTRQGKFDDVGSVELLAVLFNAVNVVVDADVEVFIAVFRGVEKAFWGNCYPLIVGKTDELYELTPSIYVLD